MSTVVEETLDDFGKPRYKVTNPKTKTVYSVQKEPGGFVFYSIRVSEGYLPKELSTRYLTPTDGINAVAKYLEHLKETIAVRRENVRNSVKERNGRSVQSDNPSVLRKGTAD